MSVNGVASPRSSSSRQLESLDFNMRNPQESDAVDARSRSYPDANCCYHFSRNLTRFRQFDGDQHQQQSRLRELSRIDATLASD